MNVKQIIETYLKENGFDGLFNTDGECACLIGDFMPCGMVSDECEAGYKKDCDCEGQTCNFHVTAEKGT